MAHLTTVRGGLMNGKTWVSERGERITRPRIEARAENLVATGPYPSSDEVILKNFLLGRKLIKINRWWRRSAKTWFSYTEPGWTEQPWMTISGSSPSVPVALKGFACMGAFLKQPDASGKFSSLSI